MTLFKCEECGNDVSTKAKACPKCGARTTKSTKPIWLVICLIILIAAILFTYKTSSTDKDTPTHKETPVEKSNREIQEAAHECARLIKEGLNDPDSAEFYYKNVNAIAIQDHDKKLWTLELPMRARNTFNAKVYVVFQCRLQSGMDNTDWELVSVKQIG